MNLRIYRAYCNTLDPMDPERVVTTNHRRYARHWWSVKVRAESSTAAWGFTKRVQWAPDLYHPGMVEAWRVGLDNEVERRRAPARVASIVSANVEHAD